MAYDADRCRVLTGLMTVSVAAKDDDYKLLRKDEAGHAAEDAYPG